VIALMSNETIIASKPKESMIRLSSRWNCSGLVCLEALASVMGIGSLRLNWLARWCAGQVQ
jgi:hypothetical protein